MPKILVDTASRPGMSGSPVLYRCNNYFKVDKDGNLADDGIFGAIFGFVGVYSGRIEEPDDKPSAQCECECPKCKEIHPDESDTQLGIVWKTRVIQEIVEGKCLDTGNYPKQSL